MIEAGRFHRFPGAGKSNGNTAGWCKLFPDGMGGTFGDYSTGLQEDWQASRDKPVSEAERTAFAAHVKQAKEDADAERRKTQKAAAEKAAAIWKAAKPAPADHAYLVQKGIKPHGARLHGESLVIPVRIGAVLSSLQFIGVDGAKKFLTDGQIAGGYFSIGNPEGAAALCICEGFATGASIHEATGHPVATAFNAGNLLAVAVAMRAKFPTLPLVLCADDDFETAGNPGITKATAAAREVAGLLAVPDFGADRQSGHTDMNDLHAARGHDAVAKAIAGAAAPAMPEPQPEAESPPVTEPATIPSETERPCFRVLGEWTERGGQKYRPGVWFFSTDKEGSPLQAWVCSPLHCEAVTHDQQENNFGRLLRFKTTAGKWREWSMPMDLLAGDGAMLRAELLAMGVEIDPTSKARNLLASYLQDRAPKRRIRCATQVGWCGEQFVLPDIVIGPKAAGVTYQSGERGHDEYTQAGTLDGWRAGIAARAVGNPLLLLALSASFAGPILARCNAESGGIHFVGDSSTGKTTALEVACATWGGPGYRRSWRATANGMEGAAALFNDCLLALDEISECDPREVGAIVYALGNGRGKQRASRSGSARGITRWRCFVISSGERTIATAMLEGGQRAKAGQAVRLLDIPAARTFGAWDDLHGAESAAAFSDDLKRAAAQHHGLAGRAFLGKLTHDVRDFCATLEQVKALPMFSAVGGEGQDRRAAARFALIGMAGELATEYGVTGWPEGAAIEAAALAFGLWRMTRGKGNDEQRQILDRVSSFIERHGDSRFSDAEANGEAHVRERAGWWRDSMGERTYLFTADAMREALKGFDFNRGLDALQSAGALPAPGANGERARSLRIAGRGLKLYQIDPDMLDGGKHGT
jgi:putative DNA primase/helicase